MAIIASDLKWYGSAVMADDDVTTNVGGVEDTSKKVEFFDVQGLVQVVSSTTVDTTQQITVSYRNTTSPTLVQTEAKVLNGQTPVLMVSNMERLLKAVKNAITQGDVAVESQAAMFTGTLVSATVDMFTLPASGSAVDNFYQPAVIRITAGTGAGQIGEIIGYVGATKQGEVSKAWAVIPDATSVVRIAKGKVFEKTPFEIFQVRRPHFNSAADVPGGVVRTFYEKIFARNMNAVTNLINAVIREQADLTGESTFGLEATTSGSGSTGVGNNRQVAPAGVTFDSSDKAVPGNTLFAGNIPGAGTASFIGVWLKLTRQPGDQSLNQTVTMRLQGQTS